MVPETLELVGLDGKGDRMPDELSGGEQQRVAIARAFVNRPMILIADEPTGNLDPTTSVGIMKLLDRINRTGTTVLMATHDAGIVDQMRKRVIELEDGRSSATRRRASTASRTNSPTSRPQNRASDKQESPSSMQLRYVFSELGQGLRRNLSMHVAVILTLFVSLTLVGLGVLLKQQAKKAEDHWGSQLQITVFLCKDKDDERALQRRGHRGPEGGRSSEVVDENPEVADWHIESKEEAFEKVKELLGPEQLRGAQPARDRRGDARVGVDHAEGPDASSRASPSAVVGPRRRVRHP